MSRIRARAFAALALLVAASSGCRDHGAAKGSQFTTVQLVHPPELRSYLSAIKEQVYNERTPLGDGSTLRIELFSEMAMPAAERIATGDLQPDAWLASSSSVVRYHAAKLTSEGVSLEQCDPLFGTPVVFGVGRAQLSEIGTDHGTVSWAELLKRRSEGSRPVALGHGTPRLSGTGLAALLQLAYLASGQSSNALTRDSLQNPKLLEKLRGFESYASRYGLSESYLLAETARTGAAQLRVALTTEQQLAFFNANLLPADHAEPLVGLNPAEGSEWEDYSLCTARQVTPWQREGLARIRSALLSTEGQAAAARCGFRTLQGAHEETPPAERRERAPTRLPPVEGEVVDTLLHEWNGLMRPAAFVVAIDNSGSMEGEPLRTAKEQIRNMIARAPERDLKALVSLGSRAALESPLGSDPAPLLSRLDLLQVLGASAVYDGIDLALDQLSNRALASYRRMVIVVTDGGDRSSDTEREALLERLRQGSAHDEISLIVIALASEDSELTDLRQIASAGGGILREAKPGNLASVFQDVLRNIQGAADDVAGAP